MLLFSGPLQGVPIEACAAQSWRPGAEHQSVVFAGTATGEALLLL